MVLLIETGWVLKAGKRTDRNPVSSALAQILLILHLSLNHEVIVGFVANLFTWLREINVTIDMRARRQFKTVVASVFLLLTLTLVGSVIVNVNAQWSPPYPFPPTFPVNNFDFSITTSTTLVKIQPGQTGGLVVWVNLYCPNSTTTIRCDSTVLQTITLSILGCPAGAFCSLDRQQVLVQPLYQAGSNLIIYTFATITPASGLTLVTVVGTDQFGHTHSATFGAIVCYC